jgi:hypothetical protein
MSGGILQLVSYGSADVYLTGNPDITYWRQISRRYTNFAVEPVIQTWAGTADFGRRTSVTISRTGDLIHKMYLEVTLPAITKDLQAINALYASNTYTWCRKVGLALIKSVELEIGGSRIDRHTSDFLDIWSSLTEPGDHRDGYARMIGDFEDPDMRRADKPMTLFIPLRFFFNQSHTLALPLISISFHDVRLNFEFRSLNELLVPPPNPYLNPSLTSEELALKQAQYRQETTVTETAATSMQCDLFADMVYLDQIERRRFAKNPQEIIVQVTQFLGDEVIVPAEASDGALARRITLNFVHPVKELLWTFTSDQNIEDRRKRYFDYEDSFEEVSLLLNGNNRFKPRRGGYFRYVQPYQHHTTTPKEAIHCYSFALRPEESQASGTMNFSRIDQAHMIVKMQLPKKRDPLTPEDDTRFVEGEFDSGKLRLYAISYNVLRIKSGLAGLAYSN